MKPQELASQLRFPNGAEAPEVARGMNEANRSLNQKCINLLQISTSDSVLEIGPGNGAFAPDIINMAKNVSYVGLDWSSEMVTEAERLNEIPVEAGRAEFRQGSSEHIAFEAGSFDKVLAVHTLYFWEQPEKHLVEIRRVMKPLGLFCIAFGDRSFMKDLPFVPYGFELYDKASACELLYKSGFRAIDAHQYQERGRSNTGDMVDKIINILVCEA